MNIRKKKALLVSLTALSATALGVGVMVGVNNSDITVLGEPLNPYLNSITLNAADFASGTGKINKNGNEFTYSGVTVSDGVATLISTGLISGSESGKETVGGLVGAGFEKFTIKLASSYEGALTLNGKTQLLNLDPGDNVLDVNSKSFEVSTGVALSFSSLTLTYECKSTLIEIDAKDNDYIWNTEVMSNYVEVGPNQDYLTKVYMTKQEDGIYMFAKQHVKEQKEAGDGWWEHDNLELRFGNENMTIMPDRRFNDDNIIYQIWFSSLKTSNIGDGNFAVSDFSGNENDGYNISYEAFLSWNKLKDFKYDLSYSDQISFVVGISYKYNWSTTREWSAEPANLEHFNVVKENGIGWFSYSDIKEPTSHLDVNKETFVSNSYFNLGCQTITMDGSKSWVLHVDLDSTNGADAGNGLALEICSPGWSQGGWSVRKDWWAWGGWNNTGGEGNAGPHDENGVSNWIEALFNINAKLRISFNSINGMLSITGYYESKHESHLGEKIYVSFISNAVGYRGNMEVKFGASFGTLKLNDVSLVKGTVA